MKYSPVLSQALALDIFHGDEDFAPIFFDLMDGADIGMGEGSGSLGFPEEPHFGFRVVDQLLGQEFKSGRTLELAVLGLIDNPHSSSSQFFDDSVFFGECAS